MTSERNASDDDRVHRLSLELIDRFELDLAGLVVYTEAASGAYRFNAIMAGVAGAEQVFAVTADSAYGAGADVREDTERLAEKFGVADRVEVTLEKIPDQVGAADVITNSGFVRPIDRHLIGWAKPTAVVPLMWEPWEIRRDELDVAACKERGVLVLGTRESAPPCDMRPYSGILGARLVLELGLEIRETRVILVGDQPTLGVPIREHLERLGARVAWFGTAAPDAQRYDRLHDHVVAEGSRSDVLLIADHAAAQCLLGDDAPLQVSTLERHAPNLRIGVVAGQVDEPRLRRSSLVYHPPDIAPPGYMSYHPYVLGVRPVLELYAAGLKVGEAMARARRAGASVAEAAAAAVRSSPALDLEGDDAWL